jgi:hypothetical protein
MIVKVANKTIKHPIELYIPDEQWEELKAIADKNELNARLQKLAMAHIAKHGYEMGYCSKRNKRVTLKDCMNCGIGQGWGSGAANYQKWELCKKENINYKHNPSEPLLRRIKDEKLAAKMAPQSKAEMLAEQTFSEDGNDRTKYVDASEEFVRHVRDKEQS